MDSDIIKKAKKLMEITNGNICNHCLGRKFSESIEGSENMEKGKIIREKLDINDYNPTKQHINSGSSCELCDDIFMKIDYLKNEKIIINKVKDKINYLNLEYNDFLLGSKISGDILEKNKEIDDLLGIEEVENLKKDINRKIGKELEDDLKKEVNFNDPDIVIIIDLRELISKSLNDLKNSKDEAINIKVRIQINPIFIEGRYLKFIRDIPQTKWPCRKCKGKGCENCDFTGKLYQESVEELISNIFLKETKGYESKFHGAGREDIDVRMLGTGRPFVLEIKEPKKRCLDLDKIAIEVNEYSKGKTEYNDLKYVKKDRKAEIKVSSPDTYKTYSALVECEEEVSENKLIPLQSLNIIQQRTPNRVSHRRADKIREKEVKELTTKLLNSKSFEMIIKTQGGLYIKELISGDENRTKPNISELLGIKSICKQLDVIEVSSEK